MMILGVLFKRDVIFIFRMWLNIVDYKFLSIILGEKVLFCIRKLNFMKLYYFNENFRNFMVYYFSMAEVDSSNLVMLEWVKLRDKNVF